VDTAPIDAVALVQAALDARQRAYAPYSHYLVGAAVLTADGAIIIGCNVENASYPASLCAERVALSAAVAQGYHDFVAIAVATLNGGSPCGICRQVMAELGPTMIVYISDVHGTFQTNSIEALLPGAFRGDSLVTAE